MSSSARTQFGLTLVIALTTIPAFLYIFLEKFIFRGNVAVMGARYVFRQPLYALLRLVLGWQCTDNWMWGSIWVFLLLSAEAMKTHKANPNFR